MTRARSSKWRVILTAVFALVVSLGASMPAFARMIAGPAAHVCHCETRGGHAHCACPICFPELRDDADRDAPEGIVKGVCGDDDAAFRVSVDTGVPSSSIVVVLAPLPTFVPRDEAPIPVAWRAPTDPRPPRTSHAA